MALSTVAAEVYRDFALDGVPSSGVHEPKKSEIRTLLGGYEQVINSFLASGGKVYISKATLDADLAHVAKTMAWVIGDPVAANNGVYQKQGASGAGSWTRIADLPYSFIVASDAGAGTPDAIVATSSIPVSSSALVLLGIFDTNSGSPVTVSFNGEEPLTIKSNSGNDIAPGGLVSGMLVMGRVLGSTFRIVTDQVSAAIIAQAEAAQIAAAEWAEGVEPGGSGTKSAKEWALIAAGAAFGLVPVSGTGDGSTADLTLPIDPGLASNVVIMIDGVVQQPGAAFTVDGTTLTWSEAPPDGLPIFGFIVTATQVSIGTPDDNTVGTDKIVDKSVTIAKLQDIPSKNLIGRNSSGAGVPELISFTAAGLQLLQSPDLAAQQAYLGVSGKLSFSAHKNGIDQGGIAVNTLSKISFGSELRDAGGYYDTANSRWQPPSGIYRIAATVHLKTPPDGSRLQIAIYKNGAVLRSAFATSSVASNSSVSITSQVESDGDDYFEVYATVLGSSGTYTADGSQINTWFEGESL